MRLQPQSDRSGERRKFVIGLMLLASVGFLCPGLVDKHTTLLVVALRRKEQG